MANQENILNALKATFAVEKSQLKLLATIANPHSASSDGKEIQWVIFFSVSESSLAKSKNGKTITKVKAKGKPPQFEALHSEARLILLPLTDAALHAAESNLARPEISCPEIIIRNNVAKTDSWADYKFWYQQEEPDKWQKDWTITLGPNGRLGNLSNLGN